MESAAPPETVICTHRVKPGEEPAFLRLVEAHWPTLRRLALATDEATRMYRGRDAEGGTVFVEIFTWADADAASAAHENAEVGAVWGPMAALTESRCGRPAMEFPHVQPIALDFGQPGAERLSPA